MVNNESKQTRKYFRKMVMPMESSNEVQYGGLLGMVASVRPQSKSVLYGDGEPCFRNIFRKSFDTKVDARLKHAFCKNDQYVLESIETCAKLFNNAGKSPSFPYEDIDMLQFHTLSKTTFNRDKLIQDSCRHRNNHYNEFFLMDKNTKMIKNEYYSAAYDVLLLYAARRMELFKHDLALRIYNICLPPGKINIKICDNKHEFLIVPMVTLHGKPNKSEFRRTLSISLLLIPINEQFKKRDYSPNEMFNVLWPKTGVSIQDNTPLTDFLDNTIKDYMDDQKNMDETINNPSNLKLEELIKIIFRKILSIVNAKELTNNEKDSIDIQVKESLQKVSSCLTNKLTKEDIASFHLGTYTDNYAKNEILVKKLVHPYHYFTDNHGGIEIFPATFDLKSLNVNDENLFDSGYVVFYNPRESYLLLWFNSELEAFPLYSLKWTFILDLYMLLELSILKIMIHSFYHEVEGKDRLSIVRDIEKDLVIDLDEFYDQDLSFQSYKSTYKKIKIISGIIDSYDRSEKKIQTIKEILNVRAERTRNHWLSVLTLLGVVFTVHQAFPHAIPHEDKFFIIGMITAFALVVTIMAGKFTPLIDRVERWMVKIK